MRVIICGSRTWVGAGIIAARVRDFASDTIVITGGAVGVDQLAHSFAVEAGLSTEEYPADWKTYGRAAGPVRNAQMLDSGADLVIAFWDGESPGTKDMINKAKHRKVPTEIHYADGRHESSTYRSPSEE